MLKLLEERGKKSNLPQPLRFKCEATEGISSNKLTHVD